jgi:acetyl-CoA synthetase
MMLEKYVSRVDFSSYEDFKANFRINVPELFNFAYDVMDELARKKPDAPALVWCDERGAEATFTYAELKLWSDKTANFFAKAGIGKGDPVMLILKRRYEFWFSILALHKLGAIAIPATHLLTTKDIVYRNTSADIKMIVTVDDAELRARVDEAQAKSPTLVAKASLGGRKEGWLDFTAGVEGASPEFARPTGPAAPANDDIMLLYFTSGTTGMPKMVRHDFTYPLGHILTAKCWQGVKEGGLHLTVSDTGWAKAMWGKIYGQWLSECAVFVYDYDRFVPKDLLSVIAKHGVTSFCAPPTIYRFFIKEDLRAYDFSKLERCAVAGEPLNPEVFNRFKEETGLELKEGYGQTELVVVVATYPWVKPKPGSMGRPSPGYDLDIVDDEGRPCEVGEEGQIVVRAGAKRPVGMFGGYYRDQALTDSVWHDGLYYTGDMAWKDEDGYFWFIGRADDLIKSSGYRIGPFEVESALLEHPAVLECAITAVPDPDRGQIVKATIVLAKGYSASDALKLELQEHVKKVTAPYKYPRAIDFVAELPKTISGKIRRVEIRGSKQG